MFTRRMSVQSAIKIAVVVSLGFILSLTPILFDSSVGAQESSISSAYIGVWDGQGFQSNGTDWSILISIVPGRIDSVVGTVAYPSLGCGGELSLLASSNNSIELLENLTYGNGQCIDRGTVSLRPLSSTRLSYAWADSSGSQDAEGEVRRISDS